MVDSTVQPFEFKGNQVRVLTDGDGAPWFIAKDVCDILGTHTKDIRATLDEDEISTVDTIDIGGFSTVIDVSNGGRSPIIISEPGLYRLVMRSRKPAAKEFQRWVTHEVLPQIRRTGRYETPAPDDDMTILARAVLISDKRIKALEAKTQHQESVIAEQDETIGRLTPKADALDDFTKADATYSMTEAAQLLANGGRELGLKRFANWLLDHKWVRRNTHRRLVAYQDKIDAGLLKTKAYPARLNEQNEWKTFPPKILVTPKGLARIHTEMYGTQPHLEGVD